MRTGCLRVINVSPCPTTRRKGRSKITSKMAQKNNPPKMTLSRAFAQLRGSTEATSRSLAAPLAFRAQNLGEPARESQPNPRLIDAPELALEATEGETINEHPLAWDAYQNCQLRGEYRDMFHCMGCEKAFHPFCVSTIGAGKPHDPRYYEFLCPSCAENNTVLQLLANDE